MMLFIGLLLLVESVSWRGASCFSISEKGNIVVSENVEDHRRDENSIIDEIRDDRNRSPRFRRDSERLNGTEPSIRMAYDRAMNRTIEDYFAQRKAVMERYYARQREIINKFGSKTTSQSPQHTTTTTIEPTTEHSITEDEATSEESPTASSKIVNSSDKTDSIVGWNDRATDGGRKVREKATDSDLQAESSNTVAGRADAKGIPGYYRLGEFRGSKDEKIVYQHNLGVGLKGSSQLEAYFEVILEGAFTITVIEAFPYANTRAHFSWISGGPASNSVKLKLKGYDNEGFSYTIKVWAVPA